MTSVLVWAFMEGWGCPFIVRVHLEQSRCFVHARRIQLHPAGASSAIGQALFPRKRLPSCVGPSRPQSLPSASKSPLSLGCRSEPAASSQTGQQKGASEARTTVTFFLQESSQAVSASPHVPWFQTFLLALLRRVPADSPG